MSTAGSSHRYNDYDIDIEEDRRRRRIIPENELRSRKELFTGINRQRQKEQVLAAVRAKQFPLFLAKQDISFEDLADDDQRVLLNTWSDQDHRLMVLDALERIASATERLLDDTRLRNVRRGQLFGTRFLLPAANPLVQIDLVEPENSVALPGGTLLDVPRVPVPKMTLFNEGPSPGRLLVATNLDSNSTKAQVSIPPTSTYVFDTGEPVLEFLNLRATGGDITVNIILEI